MVNRKKTAQTYKVKEFKENNEVVVDRPEKKVDPAPKTFPKLPDGFDSCTHSNRKFIKSEGGFNCLDCGFFVPLSAFKKDEKPASEPIHSKIHEPVRPEVPDIPDNYNLMELPSAIFARDDVGFLKSKESLGDVDRKKLNAFKQLLDQGYKVKNLAYTNNNSYLFFFEK